MQTKKPLPVRLTSEEREIIGQAAHVTGRSVASYMRTVALKQARADLKEVE